MDVRIAVYVCGMEPEQILQRYFNFPSFRPFQKEIVESIINEHDTFALLPTGAGKSICFQVPGVYFYQQGFVTIVVSPLVALMKDQVDHLLSNNIPATFVNHTLDSNEKNKRLEQIKHNEFAFVYVSPERLMTKMFCKLCQNIKIKLLVVDEAHCISQWGHDFRPEYSQITNFIKQLPQRPIVAAFTATATRRVEKEVIQLLSLCKPCLFHCSAARPNLHLLIKYCPNSQQQELFLLQSITKHKNEAGIIYCSTRANTEMVTELLQHFGFACSCYHAGLTTEVRTQVQTNFLQNKTHLIVATNAFGMGIDKPDISFIIHFNLPASLESYYQEVGRAGRDGRESFCYLFFLERDLEPLIYLIRNSGQIKQKQKQLQKMVKHIFTSKSDELTVGSHVNSIYGNKVKYLHQQSIKQSKYLPIISKTTLQYLSLHRPHTKEEFRKIPGIGFLWMEKYYPTVAVNLMDNVLHSNFRVA